jgi:hypothetical protein
MKYIPYLPSRFVPEIFLREESIQKSSEMKKPKIKVFPLICPDFDEQILERSPDGLTLPNGEEQSDVPMSGWQTEDGCTFFLENGWKPKFHPQTGEPLEIVPFEPKKILES